MRHVKTPSNIHALFYVALLTSNLVTGCGASNTSVSTAPDANPHLKLLADRLIGSFTSEAQSKRDPDYSNTELHMTRIWSTRSDGYWLYVEQAAADTPEKPDIQRVYNVVARQDCKFESIAFELPGDPLKFAGAWNDPGKLAGLDTQQLRLCAGCSIVFDLMAGVFTGSTTANGCANDLHGASYATSQVVLTAETLEIWDRGFDAAGKQVWGATKGPYIFRRVNK